MATYPVPPPSSGFGRSVWIRVGPAGGAAVHQLRLPVNPDQEIDYDARVTLIQTQTGAYFDDYGLGVTTLTLTGNTAWMSPKGLFDGHPVNGWQAAKHLRQDILEYYFASESGHTSPSSMEMVVTDYSTDESWQVKPVPPPLRLQRQSSNPMVVSYTAVFRVEQDLIGGTTSAQAEKDPLVTEAISATAAMAQAAASIAASVTRVPKRTYVVQPGDTLWSIATSFYGSGALYRTILNANLNVVPNPNLIFPGETLVIPPPPGASRSLSSVSALS